jgi:hypothetical protein
VPCRLTWPSFMGQMWWTSNCLGSLEHIYLDGMHWELVVPGKGNPRQLVLLQQLHGNGGIHFFGMNHCRSGIWHPFRPPLLVVGRAHSLPQKWGADRCSPPGPPFTPAKIQAWEPRPPLFRPGTQLLPAQAPPFRQPGSCREPHQESVVGPLF